MKDIYEYYDCTRDLKAKYSINDKGQKDGVLVEFYEDGTLKNILTYKEDKLNGEYKEFSIRGKLIETGYYQNDIKEGNVIKFVNDGMLEGYQKNGKMIGEAVFSSKYENNNLKTRIHVKERLIEGEKEDFDIDGKLINKISRSYDGKNITDTFETYGDKFIEKGTKVNFKLDGKYQKFLADTNILVEEKNYKNNVLDGEYKRYSFEGNLEEKGQYVDGKQDGIWITYSSTNPGVVKDTFKYKNGILEEIDNANINSVKSTKEKDLFKELEINFEYSEKKLGFPENTIFRGEEAYNFIKKLMEEDKKQDKINKTNKTYLQIKYQDYDTDKIKIELGELQFGGKEKVSDGLEHRLKLYPRGLIKHTDISAPMYHTTPEEIVKSATATLNHIDKIMVKFREQENILEKIEKSNVMKKIDTKENIKVKTTRSRGRAKGQER